MVVVKNLFKKYNNKYVVEDVSIQLKRGKLRLLSVRMVPGKVQFCP